MKTCTIDGCNNTGRMRRGWCNAHYFRWYRTGDTGPSTLTDPRISNRQCDYPGCTGGYVGRGYCMTHYSRLMSSGTPDKPGHHYNWTGEGVSYKGLHRRLERFRGKASGFACQCGSAAQHWAYDNNDPEPKYGTTDKGYPVRYSTDLNRYTPMCATCHNRFDASTRAAA